jgi:uncharacterized membrane protein (GlpM family)
MNIAAGLGAFLIGAFILITVGVLNPSIQFYIGGIFIAFLMFGIIAVYANAVRQTRKLETEQKKGDGQAAPAPSS